MVTNKDADSYIPGVDEVSTCSEHFSHCKGLGSVLAQWRDLSIFSQGCVWAFLGLTL